MVLLPDDLVDFVGAVVLLGGKTVCLVVGLLFFSVVLVMILAMG